MAFTIEHGVIQNLTKDEEKGSASCEINNVSVDLHRDLTTKVSTGDEVIIVGTMEKDKMRALALKDVSKSNILGIDTTNYILLMGVGLYVFTMFSVFFIQGLMHHAQMSIEVMHTIILLVGLTWSLFFLRNMVRAISALNCIKRMTT